MVLTLSSFLGSENRGTERTGGERSSVPAASHRDERQLPLARVTFKRLDALPGRE